MIELFRGDEQIFKDLYADRTGVFFERDISLSLLQKTLNICFAASLLKNEGEPVRFHLAMAPRQPALASLVFANPLEISAENLRRLAAGSSDESILCADEFQWRNANLGDLRCVGSLHVER